MLPDIVAEVLHFLSRRDLDKACGISIWLDAMIAQCCAVYPFRPTNGGLHTTCTFCSMDEVTRFIGRILRHSFVETLELGDYSGSTVTLSSRHWETLVDAIRSGAVRHFRLVWVDFSALNKDAFLVSAGCRGLQSFLVHKSVVPSGFITDDLILGFFFPMDAWLEGQSRELELESTGEAEISSFVLAKLLERLESSPVRPTGKLTVSGASTARQRGLSAYAHYLVPGPMRWSLDATYRFPSIDDDNKTYEVGLTERSYYTCLRFCYVHHSS